MNTLDLESKSERIDIRTTPSVKRALQEAAVDAFGFGFQVKGVHAGLLSGLSSASPAVQVLAGMAWHSFQP